jgi:hypothetical protein
MITWDDFDSDDNATITLYYDIDNVPGGEVLIGSGPVAQGEDPDGPLWDTFLWNTTAIFEGDYYIKASTYDGITAVYNYSQGVVQVRHPPAISLLEPDGISDIADREYIISWTDKDNDDDAWIALYYDDDLDFNGTEITGNLSEDSTEDQFLWDTSGLPESSSWYIYAEITDGKTIFRTYSPGRVNITHPPSITLVEPDGLDDLADREYTIQWSDEDTDDNAMITLYYDGDTNPGGETLIGTVVGGEDPDGEGDEYTWDTTHIFEGLYYIKAVITDPQYSVCDYSIGRVAVLHNKTPSITLVSPLEDIFASRETQISWIDEDVDDNATITLYYDEDQASGGEVLITVVPQGEDSTVDNHLWDLSQVPEGS